MRKIKKAFEANVTESAKNTLWELIPEDIKKALSGEQLKNLMELLNSQYHKGFASAGAEKVDSEAVYVDGVGIVDIPEKKELTKEEKKELTKEEKIQKLIDYGAKRWTRGRDDRLYVSPYALGYRWERSKRGFIAESKDPDGEDISHCQMENICQSKIYLDINKDFEIHHNHDSRVGREFIERFIEEALNYDSDRV